MLLSRLHLLTAECAGPGRWVAIDSEVGRSGLGSVRAVSGRGGGVDADFEVEVEMTLGCGRRSVDGNATSHVEL